jgi:hypothetical protein
VATHTFAVVTDATGNCLTGASACAGAPSSSWMNGVEYCCFSGSMSINDVNNQMECTCGDDAELRETTNASASARLPVATLKTQAASASVTDSNCLTGASACAGAPSSSWMNGIEYCCFSGSMSINDVNNQMECTCGDDSDLAGGASSLKRPERASYLRGELSLAR